MLFPRLRSFLTALTYRERFEDSLDEEVLFHLNAQTEDLVRADIRRHDNVFIVTLREHLDVCAARGLEGK